MNPALQPKLAQTAPRNTVRSRRPRPALVRSLWAAMSLLLLIAVAIVVRRTDVLFFASGPAAPPQRAALDATFEPHPLLVMIHIIPGLLFLLLGATQFMPRLRQRRPRLHRWAGRVAVGSGLVVGTTALVMSPQMAIGGANEMAATMFFGVIFLFCLVKGFLSIRARRVVQHREWMIRAFAIALAIATIRPIMGIFFATSRLTHLTPHEFFGIAFWLGFSIHLVAAEAWINYTRARAV